MKKIIVLVFILSLMIPTTGWVCGERDGDDCGGGNTNSNTIVNNNDNTNTNKNTNNNTNTNTNTNTNVNENTSNSYSVGSASADASVTINNEKQMLGTPLAIANPLGDLSFGEVKMVRSFITDARLREYTGELIIAVVVQCKAKAGDVIKKTIELVKDASTKENLTKCRIISLSHKSTRMWTTGGSMTVGGSGFVGSGGMSGALGILPSFGRMTADDIVDIIVVRVAK